MARNPENVPVTTTFSIRGSKGIALYNGPPKFQLQQNSVDPSKMCKVFAWSNDGKLFAWCNNSSVKVVTVPEHNLIAELPRPKTLGLRFSPKSTHLTTWEPYQVTQDTPANTPNLHIWNLATKESVKSYVQKRQSAWEPQWSQDEKLLVRNINNEVQFYETATLEKMAHKLSSVKVFDFSLSPGTSANHVLCYTPGVKGQPSFVKMFRYPQLEQPVANKSFFQADRVEFKWDRLGTSALVLTTVDVDTSGVSYYGKQALHFLDTKGNTALVQLPKEGPIYSVEWSPKGNEFCVVYGYMPAKATLFNQKCEPKFDFGTGPRNCAFYNCHGSILLLGGFGNLRGKMEAWDLKSKKMIAPVEIPDTTYLEWSPDGEHFLTCTTAPRLRVGNGVRIWHYSGSLLFEEAIREPDELWEATWQPLPYGTFPEKAISVTKVEGIQPNQPVASKEIYRPPGSRGREAVLKILEEREQASDPTAKAKAEALSKSALKNKKKREARKAKKEDGEDGEEENEEKETKKVDSGIDVKLTGDLEKDKQLRNLKKKLDQIAKLKADKAAGKTLELNQLEKLSKESEFLAELKKLSI